MDSAIYSYRGYMKTSEKEVSRVQCEMWDGEIAGRFFYPLSVWSAPSSGARFAKGACGALP